MLEHHVDAFPFRELADLAFEALGPVVDDVVGPERFRAAALLVVADGREHRAADRLRHLDRGGADAGAAGMDEDRFAGLEAGVVEQHVLHRAEADRRARRLLERHPLRHRDDEPLGPVDERTRKAVEVEAEDAGDVLAEIVAAFPAGAAMAAGFGPVHHDRIADLEARPAGADRSDFARRLDADDLGHLALGESHAAEAPQVEVVEADRPHPHLHLAFRRRRRRIDLGQAKVAVAEELEGAHSEIPCRSVSGQSCAP